MFVFLGLIGMTLFGLNIWAIVLSGQALNNLVCSEQLKTFFIGAIVALGCLILGVGTNYVVSSSGESHTEEKKNFTAPSVLVWIFTLVWACLGVGWIQSASSCSHDIIRSANTVLALLFVNVSIVCIAFIVGFLSVCCLLVNMKSVSNSALES